MRLHQNWSRVLRRRNGRRQALKRLRYELKRGQPYECAIYVSYSMAYFDGAAA